MNAIRINCRLDSHLADLPELAPLVGKRVQIIVLEEAEQPDPPPGPKAGPARGQIWMAPDFDQTPEDFKDYL